MNPGLPAAKPVFLYFHFRSPYCYLASKTLWPIFDDFHTALHWRPLGDGMVVRHRSGRA